MARFLVLDTIIILCDPCTYYLLPFLFLDLEMSHKVFRKLFAKGNDIRKQ